MHDEIDLLDDFLDNGLFLEAKPAQDADIVLWQAGSSRLDQYFAAYAGEWNLPPKPQPRYLAGIKDARERIG